MNGNTMKRGFAYRLPSLLLAVALGAIAASFSCGVAYAAEDASEALGITAAQGVLKTQDSTSSITAVPSNSASMYEVYSTYFFINAGMNANAGSDLRLEYRVRGGKWKTVNTTMYTMNSYTIKGLRPNTTYQARLYYESNGMGFYPYGDIGPKSKAVTFKTGPKKKPAVKSVSVKAIQVKRHKQRIYGYYTGVYMGSRTYYTYKIRTTVTFKKAPKTKFVMINYKKFKGNKKKYTVTTKKLVNYDKRPIGNKYQVSVCTYQNKTWKGYSLLYQKNFKIR